MAAANTDKLKKLARRWVGQIGSGGVADGATTTIPFASTTNLPTDTAVIATIDRVDVNGVATPDREESVVGVVSVSGLTSCIRGVEGTAQAHDAGAVVEILVTAKGYNDMIDWALVEHNQDGTHKTTPTSLANDPLWASAGDLAYGSANDTGARLAIGNNGDMLGVASGLPAWLTARFYIGTFSRDLTAASGDVSYTGVGFKPKAVGFFGLINATTVSTEGFGDASSNQSKSRQYDGNNTYDSTCLRIYQASGAIQGAVIKTLDTDGFTLTWTKNGSPTGTANFFYIAFR